MLPILLFFAIAPCDDSLKQATAALQQNNPAQAIRILSPLASKCKQSGGFLEVLGVANELSGDKDGAETALRDAVALEPSSSRLLAELGATLLRNGKPKEAGTVLDRALVLDAGNIVILKYAIGAAVGAENWTRAGALFERMNVQRDSTLLRQEPALAMWLARTWIETKQSDRIEPILGPLRDSMPPGLLFSLGTLLAQRGMYELAIKYFEAVPSGKADDALYYNLGLSYSHLGRFEDARKNYFAAIDRHPDHVDAYLHIGLDYVAAGQRRMGLPWLYKAHALDAGRTDVAYAVAEQLIGLEYFNTAEEVLTSARRRTPQDLLLLVALGDLLHAEGNSGAAIARYREALSEKPGSVAALVGMARAEASVGKNEEAKRLLTEAVQREPRDPIANGELGLLEAHAGDRGASLRHLELAWDEDRSNPEIALQLARSYQAAGRVSRALALLESIAPEMRDSKAFHLELAQVYTLMHRAADAQEERDVLATLERNSPDALHFDNPHTYVP